MPTHRPNVSRRLCLALGLVAVCGLALAGCKEAVSLPTPPPRPIAWAEVTTAEVTQRRVLPGLVRPARHAALAFEVGGRVEAVTVDVGDRVDSGAVLARLETRPLSLVRDADASAVAEANAAVREAERQFSRQARLHGDGWASGAAFDKAKAAVDSARSRLDSARARLALAEKALDDAVLRAPYAGIVAARAVEPAQQVTAGQTVFDIQGRGGPLEVAVPVPETLVAHLTEGQRLAVTLPALATAALSAVVVEIGTDAGRDGTFPLTLRLDDPPGALRTGMTAAVTVPVPGAPTSEPGASALTIPVTAFLPGEDGTAVAFVFKPADSSADANGVLERRTITLGPVTATQAVVRAGLSPGEIVAARGLAFLRAGQPVTRLGVGAARYDN